MKAVVLLSGTGRTLENLLKVKTTIGNNYGNVPIVQVISDRPNILGLEIAEKAGIPTAITKESDHIFELCDELKADLVVCAGFLRKLTIPESYTNRVMNIHPSLLPSFGGKGMYGHKVHEAVLAHGCKMTGCTVHFVDNEYDHGPIICQRAVPAYHIDSPERLAERVFVAECNAYPAAISAYSRKQLIVENGVVRYYGFYEL